MPDAEYFLRHADPSLRLLALRELEEAGPADPRVRVARAGAAGCPAAAAIKAAMNAEGWWPYKRPRSDATVGDGVEYYAYAHAHYRLSCLAELGLDRDDAAVAKAAERYLGFATPEGDFWEGMSCLSGLNLRTFAKLGYRDDPRVRRVLAALLATDRPDGGTLCAKHEKPAVGKSGRPLKRPKSCFRGSAKALHAFTYYPGLRAEPRVRALAEYFLAREGIFKMAAPEEYVTREVAAPAFPLTWGADVIQVLYALSALGFGDDPRLARSWHALDELQADDGFVRLAWTPPGIGWKPGTKGRADDWLTLYALIARRLRATGGRP